MKKALILSYLVLFFLIVATCAQKLEEHSIVLFPVDFQEQVDLVKAKQIMDNTFLVCHSATATMSDRVAPPLEAVKRYYLEVYPMLDEFTVAIASYGIDPTEDKALLTRAVHRFGVMPKQEISQEDFIAVATYMYQFELDRPEWFEEHFIKMDSADHRCPYCTLQPQRREQGHRHRKAGGPG